MQIVAKKNRVVLLISYPFPPLGAAGVLRPYRFAKYLPTFSWKPVVLTIKEREDAPKDYTLLSDLPSEVSINRTRTFDPYLLYQVFRDKIKKLVVVKDSQQVSISEAEDVAYSGRKPVLSPLRKIKRFLLSLITMPDHQVFWFPFAVLKALSLIYAHNNNIDVLLTTSPPHSSHLVGLALQKISRIPWIADFRDPWVENFKLRDGLLTWQKGVEQFLEKLVIDHADMIIANTEKNRKNLIKRYPNFNAKKFITIHNGFDRINVGNTPSFKKFTITHTGIFYPKLNPYFFFEALNKWLAVNDKTLRSSVQVLLVGDDNDSTRAIVKRLSLEEVVTFMDRVPHKEALRIARASDVLLISLGFDQRYAGWVPIKLYDYLSCNRPILAFLPHGEAAQIIRETRTGYVINSEDYAQTVKILNTEYRNKFSAGCRPSLYSPDKEKIGRYEARYLTKQIAQVMLEVANGAFK